MDKYKTDDKDRFWGRVAITNRSEDCWDWQGDVRGSYGRIGINDGYMLSHRLAWEISNGEIPDGLFVLHKCDNPLCCNPNHLFLGTNIDNMRDKVKKNRQAKGESHGRCKLTAEQVRSIRVEYLENGKSKRSIAKRFGVGRTTIQHILNGDNWAWLK